MKLKKKKRDKNYNHTRNAGFPRDLLKIVNQQCHQNKTKKIGRLANYNKIRKQFYNLILQLKKKTAKHKQTKKKQKFVNRM